MTRWQVIPSIPVLLASLALSACDDPAVLRLEGRHLHRPEAQVAHAYGAVAADLWLMDRIPCFCGCEGYGHKAVSSCFVRRRDDQGKVAAWDYHGAQCAVCIDVALAAARMKAEGVPVERIRSMLEERYRHTGKATPTPH